MKIVKLIRYSEKVAKGTPGELYVNDNKSGDLFCYTLELDWEGNKTNISCIREGIHLCKIGIHYGVRVYKVYELQNVPGRTNVEIHIGNFLSDILGCILVGKELRIYKGKYWVKSSTEVFNKFMNKMNNEDFLLEITYAK